MRHYDLRYSSAKPHEIDTFSFDAPSLGGALDIARKSARGEWAELYQDGYPVCQLELVAESGVWLVGGLRTENSRAAVEAQQPVRHTA